MAITGQLPINIGLQNESTGSDSLYTAFHKINDNFSNLFGNSSPFNTFNGVTGISITTSNVTGNVDVTNTGVLSLTAGTNIILSGSNGNVTISSTGGGGGGGGTVTSVDLQPVSGTRLTVTGSPITSSGTIYVDLATSGVTAGSYIYPALTVDGYGRITNISNGNSLGTVTSVAATPGAGIQITGSPITTSGTLTITNTGVTRLTAGTGISLSGSNGNVTVSTTLSGGTVTSVGVSSSTLTVSGSPVVSSGTITVDIPNTLTLTGTVTGGNLSTAGSLLLSGSENLTNGGAASLTVPASYFSTTGAWTATLAAGTTGQIKTFMMVADGGDMVITVTNAGWKSSGTGTITFNDIGDGCMLQYINSKWFCIGQNGVVFA